MINLYCDRISVQIHEPGSGYKCTRFDWNGICQQVTLDGKHTYCSNVATKNNPGTEGLGLMDEFGIHTPIGYKQVGVGDWFPKIGVGFLQKTGDDPYNFFSDYPLKRALIEVDQDGENRVSFSQTSEIVNGWGWLLDKTLSVEGTTLTIDYSLQNCGEKPFATEQYNHNFMIINSHRVGPDYQLDTSFPITFDFMEGGLQVKTNRLNITETPPAHVYALQVNCANLGRVNWNLTHVPSGHGIQVREEFPLFKFALWGMSHVISPELFVWIDLQPGQKKTWQRKYNFF